RRYEKSPSPTPKVAKRVKERLAEDDAEIAALERKLGVRNKDKLPKSFEEDGLGDLLDGLDDFVSISGKKKREEYEARVKNKRRRADTDVFEGFSDDTDEEFTTDEVPEPIDNASPNLTFEEFTDEDSSIDELEGDEDDDTTNEDFEERLEE